MSEFVLDLTDSVAAKLEAQKPAQPVNDPNHVTRQEAARQAAEAIGIEWPKTILPEGTALYDSGVQRLRADRAKWRKLPMAKDAIVAVKNALAAEDRRDVADVPVNELRLHSDNARLYREGKSAASASGYDSHAFRQLLAQIPQCGPGEAPRGFGSSLLYLTSAERAAILNARLPKATAKVMLRTKMAHTGQRIVRAVLSERYADVSDIHVAEGIERGLNGDLSNVRLDYKPGDAQSKFEMLWPSEIPVHTFRVGDVHYAGVAVDNSETGQGSLRIRPYLFRAACANLTLALGEGVEVVLKHMGNAERVRQSMRAAIHSAIGQIEPMIAVIQNSAQDRVSDFSSKPMSEIISALAKKYEVSDATTAEWQKTYAASYAQSPTTWGVTSALTEATQRTSSWWGAQQEEEEAASKILYVGVRRALSA